jgi:hypothetical protein
MVTNRLTVLDSLVSVNTKELKMRFMTFYRPHEETSGPPSPELMAAMGQLIGEWSQKGVLVTTEGLLPSAAGARVRLEGDAYTVTEGPFSNEDGAIGGYAILNADSKDQAIDLAKTFLKVVGGGESEVRQLY